MGIWPTTGLLLVNVPALQASMGLVKNISPRTYLLKAYFHEQNHAIGAYSETEVGGVTTVRSGLTSLRGQGDTYLGDEHYYLNEVINEKKARSLTVEYLKRAHPGEDWARRDIAALEDDYQTEGSQTFVFGPHMLRLIVKKIAAHDKTLSEKVVWQSLWHSELNGLMLDDKEVRRTLNLDAVFGKGFTKRLARFTKEEALNFLADEGVIDSDARLREQIHREYGISIAPRSNVSRPRKK
jgi:hypothetical protein